MKQFEKAAIRLAAIVCFATIFLFFILSAAACQKSGQAQKNLSGGWEQWKNDGKPIKTTYERISLAPGADISKLNCAWYSQMPGQAKVRIAKKAGAGAVQEFSGTSKKYKKIGGTLYYANKVTIAGLEEDTVYCYQYFVDGNWAKLKEFQTGNAGRFSVLFVGDPQIGASIEQMPEKVKAAIKKDAAEWDRTLKAARKARPEIDFIISAGDQINNWKDGNGQEAEYAGLLSAGAMASVPMAATIGNHDSRFANFRNHFNTPNAYKKEKGASPAGYDYYYSYGQALFIVLDTNNDNCKAHEALIQKAVDSHPDAKWKILTCHHDIYGSGVSHSDSDGMALRTQLTPVFDKYGIDVVLQGHDHAYSRSYLLEGDGNAHTKYDKKAAQEAVRTESTKAEYLKQNRCYKIVDRTQGTLRNPKGTLYLAAASSTGSKYYGLHPDRQDYIAKQFQTCKPSYSVIDFMENTFTVTTYDAGTGKVLDGPFTIRK